MRDVEARSRNLFPPRASSSKEPAGTSQINTAKARTNGRVRTQGKPKKALPMKKRKEARISPPPRKLPKKTARRNRAAPKTSHLRVARIIQGLEATYPDARCALDHTNALQLLVATILSAQSTDKMVNIITPALFRKYRTAKEFGDADTAELESMIHSSGFFRNKAKSIKAACHLIVEK